MNGSGKKTLGNAIDEIVAALESLDDFARPTAVRAACEHLGIAVPVPGPSMSASNSSSALPPENVGGSPPSSSQSEDIRSLKERKQPTSSTEMACLVAYYLDSLAPLAERKKEVSSKDMERYFKQAGYRLPKYLAQVLVDARASGYFDSAGRGKYKLNPVGHNLVVHSLPKTKK